MLEALAVSFLVVVFLETLNSEIYNEGYTKTLPELKNIKAKQIGINFLLS